jgi:hypothetical protein
LEKPLEYSSYIELISFENVRIASGEGILLLDNRSLNLVLVEKKKAIPYFRITGIHDEDYIVNLYLENGEKIKLSQLGYEYENLLLNLYKLRAELLLHYMLMNEEKIAHSINAKYVYTGEDSIRSTGECEIRIYKSSLVVLPYKREPIRLPLCYIKTHEISDYVLNISTYTGEKITFSMMGEKTDYCVRSLTNALDDMVIRAEKIFSEAIPELGSEKVRMAARLLADGKAAKKMQIEKLSPKLWTVIEKRLEEVGLGGEYQFLSKLSNEEIWVGVKSGLMGDLTGDYVWFMTPIYDSDPSKIGNAIVLEAASSEDVGRATYFFRLMSRPEYNSGLDKLTLIEKANFFTERLNRCMIEINFRREPIILPYEKLASPEYERYLYAVNKLPSLKLLRERYIGRVMHRTKEQWEKETEEILRFNVESRKDSEKWRE